MDPADALGKVCDTEGEIDIVSEVSPADSQRVKDSEHANLVAVDAMRIVSGLVNRDAEYMGDRNVRVALNLAADKGRLISETFAGYAHPVAAMAPPYSGGRPTASSPTPTTRARRSGSSQRPAGPKAGRSGSRPPRTSRRWPSVWRATTATLWASRWT